MKVSLRIILPVLVAIPAGIFAQQVPNGGIENWEPLLLGGGEKPVSWDTPDVIAGALGITDRVVEKTDMAAAGSFAAMLTTKDLEAPAPIGTLTVPGTLALGTIIFDPLTLETGVVGGLAMTETPTSLIGSYMYSPAAGDTMNVTVIAKKDGSEIGRGEFRSAATSTSYQDFEAVIDYTVAETPDTIQVIITSSGGFGSATAGSVLHVDELAFTGISSTDDLAAAGIQVAVYPNPTSNLIHVLNISENASTVEFISMNGVKVMEHQIENGTTPIDVSGLPAGIYLARVSQEGRTLYTDRFQIVK